MLQNYVLLGKNFIHWSMIKCFFTNEIFLYIHGPRDTNICVPFTVIKISIFFTTKYLTYGRKKY